MRSHAARQPSRSRRRSTSAIAAGASLLIGTGLALGLATPAFADFSFLVVDPAPVTVEYGETWSTTFTTGANLCYCSATVTENGVPTPFASGVIPNQNTFYVSSWDGPAPLEPGTHRLSLSGYSGYLGSGSSPTPATITVEPAKLRVDLRVVTDPNSSGNAVITAVLTGQFVDGLSVPVYRSPQEAVLPAGQWEISVTDSEGATVHTSTQDVEAGGIPEFVDYWSGVPRGEVFDASATFSPIDSSAPRFIVTGAQGLSFTSPDATTSEPGSPAPTSTPSPGTDDPAAAGQGVVPLPLLVVGGVLAIAALAVIIVLVVLLRRTVTGRGPVAADAPAQPEEARDATS